jgi:hypothetical protein
MARLLGWVNVVAGLVLLVLILSGVFSGLLENISEWNSFDTIAAKIVVAIAGILAIFSSIYLVVGQVKERSSSRG